MKKILIIEDEPNIRELVLYNLKTNGYDGIAAEDGIMGITMVHREKPDLVLLDIMLPGKNGYDICRELREEGNNTPIIMITAKTEEVDKAVSYTHLDVYKRQVEKGSIAIDGISLTVAGLGQDYFKVSVIPHTAANTILSGTRTGDTMNLENDILGKYVERLMQPAETDMSGSRRITEAFLTENGF